jgi:formylglycine-generating enzyme required for sulfatase activity
MSSQKPPGTVDSACCVPSGAAERSGPPPSAAPPAHPPTDRAAEAAAGEAATLVRLPGGRFLMGCDDAWAYPNDGEGPVRERELAPFQLDALAVSNAVFARFVAATGHVTDAERFGWSFVFAGLLPADFEPTQGVAAAPWWRRVRGADWRHPEGPRSSIAARLDHPVVHVSWNDAQAFCAWSGSRLPSEAEWEYAARGGLVGQPFPWGDELEPGGQHRMNVFQGDFPLRNTAADGHVGTAPVSAYPPNAFGLFNMTGNVWEWTADAFAPGRMVVRGGSYLCHASYCRRYRVSARSSNAPDDSTGNLGFRVAR